MVNKNLFKLSPFKKYKHPSLPIYYNSAVMEANLAVIPLVITKPFLLQLDNPYLCETLFHWNIIPKASRLSLKYGLVVSPQWTFRLLERVNYNTLYFIWEESYLFNAFMRGEEVKITNRSRLKHQRVLSIKDPDKILINEFPPTFLDDYPFIKGALLLSEEIRKNEGLKIPSNINLTSII